MGGGKNKLMPPAVAKNHLSPSINLTIAGAIGFVSSSLCWSFLHHFHLGGADFNWAHQAAQDLLSGRNPYATTSHGIIPYPLPAALAALPFASFPPEVAAALFFGISSAFLALGIVRKDPMRLLIFLAYPYWSALMTAQWTPLIMCGAFFPLLSGMFVAKPQTGLPIAFTHWSRRGLLAAAVLLLVSLILQPRWPWEWISQARGYIYFVPLLVIPGPLLAFSLWRWRDRDARLIFLASVVPQRWFYDSFILWLIPKTRRSIVATVGSSWVFGIWRWYHIPHVIRQVGLWCVLGSYIPMLLVVLVRPRDGVNDTS
jgi:hypothetical protein